MAQAILHAFLWTTTILFVAALLLHLPSRLGAFGRRLSDWMCFAPGLDVLVTFFTVLPMIVGPIVWGWGGFIGAVLGQYAALLLWTAAHELRHWGKRSGPKIYKVNNRVVGVAPNLIACFLTSLATPTFWIIRMTELVVYPGVSTFANFPKYKAREWVNVSRQKFDGLVGHDLIWCLYCDWMTGVWSLGAEMLRNVESFWCPIRFLDGKKCENCKVDYPDVDHGWTDARGNIADAVQTVVNYYEAEPRPAKNAWFGHPVRLTVKGTDLPPATPSKSQA